MIIIPARLQSTRFPQKILADIKGVPMIVATALNASKVDEVVIACDDDSVCKVCQKHRLKAVLTSPHHNSGTDRCAEACKILGIKNNEIIINVQGDEPFLEISVITSLKKVMEKTFFMGTCAKTIDKNQIFNTDLVKVVCNAQNEAIYFSRSPIPYSRDGLDSPLLNTYPYYGHLGIYGFRTESLEEFCSLQKSPLEEIEKLEQLRAIYHKKIIYVEIVKSRSIGIDTPKDLENTLKIQG